MSALHLTKPQRLQIEVMRQEISPWGLASAVVMGGVHMHLKVWDREGRSHVLVISCTPRDIGHAVNFARQKARRLVRLINERAGY